MSISQLCLLAVTRLLCIQIWTISTRSLGWFYFVSPAKAVWSTTSRVFGVSHCLSKSWFSLTLASLWLYMSFPPDIFSQYFWLYVLSFGHMFLDILGYTPFPLDVYSWYPWLESFSPVSFLRIRYRPRICIFDTCFICLLPIPDMCSWYLCKSFLRSVSFVRIRYRPRICIFDTFFVCLLQTSGIYLLISFLQVFVTKSQQMFLDN